MVRYTNRTNVQRRAQHLKPVASADDVVWRTHVTIDTCSSQQFCDAIYKHLAAQGFFTHHTVERVTVKQFLAMLAAASLQKYSKAA